MPASGVTFWTSPAGGATIALTGVILTIVVTTVLNLRTRRWQLADERRNRVIERGEEVYSLLKKWNQSNISWFLQSKLVMNDEIDYNQFLDEFIKSNDGVDLKVERIDIIFSVYFPDLSLEWDECVNLVRQASSIENSFKEDCKNGIHSGSNRLVAFQDAMLKANQQMDRTLQLLAQSIRNTTMQFPRCYLLEGKLRCNLAGIKP